MNADVKAHALRYLVVLIAFIIFAAVCVVLVKGGA